MKAPQRLANKNPLNSLLVNKIDEILNSPLRKAEFWKKPSPISPKRSS